MGVPPELEVAVKQNVEWTDLQMSNYRIAWCRKWMARAHELEQAERADAAQRHPAVAEITAGKRLLLTKEKWKLSTMKMFKCCPCCQRVRLSLVKLTSRI